jgi:hypothetical protein
VKDEFQFHAYSCEWTPPKGTALKRPRRRKARVILKRALLRLIGRDEESMAEIKREVEAQIRGVQRP